MRCAPWIVRRLGSDDVPKKGVHCVWPVCKERECVCVVVELRISIYTLAVLCCEYVFVAYFMWILCGVCWYLQSAHGKMKEYRLW